MRKRIIIDILFVFYFLILLRITVFRNGIGSYEFFSGEINLIPFADLFLTSKQSLRSFIYLFFGNIIWFVPLGFYLRKIKKRKLLNTVALGFCLSLFIEITQYIFGTGVSEVDDLMLNTTGAFIGGSIVFLIDKLKSKKFEISKKEFS